MKCKLTLSQKPDADTLFSFGSTQPFVPLYAVVLGAGGHIFMNIVCIIALWFVGNPGSHLSYSSLKNTRIPQSQS